MKMTAGFALDMTNQHTRMMYQLLSARAQLSIEINTGLKHSRGSVMARVKSWSTLDPETADWAVPRYLPISFGKGTKIGVWEDLDARIVELGGPAATVAITRKGKTDKINDAAQRRHERRIAKILDARPQVHDVEPTCGAVKPNDTVLTDTDERADITCATCKGA
jgi:hypothetical protein